VAAPAEVNTPALPLRDSRHFGDKLAFLAQRAAAAAAVAALAAASRRGRFIVDSRSQH